MGRNALPDQLKELRGTAKKCRKQTSSSSAAVCKPLTKVTPPEWLQSDARKIFVETSKMLISWKVLTKIDINLLAAYAAAYANLIKADKDIADAKGYFYKKETKTGTTIEMHPAAKMFKDSLDSINKLGVQFGLSPVSRRGIETFAPAGDRRDKASDPFDEYLR